MISPLQNTALRKLLGRATDQILEASNSSLISDNKSPGPSWASFYSPQRHPYPKEAFSLVCFSSVALHRALWKDI